VRPQQSEPKTIETHGQDCEVNAFQLDHLAQMMLHSDERLFVIARLGKGEPRRSLNQRRLHNVREYFRSYFGNRIRLERLILAEGEPANGGGRVEFYAGSRLILVTSLARQADICVHCCDYPDPRYYGRGKTDKRKKTS
jgi:hypothetical protein